MNKVLTNMNQDLSALEKQTARSNIGAVNDFVSLRPTIQDVGLF